MLNIALSLKHWKQLNEQGSNLRKIESSGVRYVLCLYSTSMQDSGYNEYTFSAKCLSLQTATE